MRQYSSESIDKLTEALAEAQRTMTHAKKDQVNPFFTTKDKKASYADLPAIIDAAKPHLTQQGLSVTQLTDFDETGLLLITILAHKTGQWMRSFYPIRPTKQDPQGFGSAITYARRYAYAAMVGVASADDDDDGNAASGNGEDKRPEPKKPQETKLDSIKQAKAEHVIEMGILPDGSLDFDAFGADIEQAILNAASMNALMSIKTANGKYLNKMKVDRPEMFDAIVQVFTETSRKYQ